MELRIRENMDTLLIDDGEVVARIKDPRYEQLLRGSAQLREQLDYMIFVIDNLSGVSIDTLEAHRVLEETRMEEM